MRPSDQNENICGKRPNGPSIPSILYIACKKTGENKTQGDMARAGQVSLK